jgi:hypothetical protein
MSLVVLNVASLSSKQSAFLFLLGTYVTLPCPVVPPATAFQLDVFLLLMQSVDLQIFLETQVKNKQPSFTPFSLFLSVLSCVVLLLLLFVFVLTL